MEGVDVEIEHIYPDYPSKLIDLLHKEQLKNFSIAVDNA